MAPSNIEQTLSLLLPTLSPLPSSLTDLATSLLAQSRARAASLKPDEEIGRTYAVCHIACERLGKKLGLEIGRVMPPCQPKVYAKLKTYLGSVLRTPVTPRRETRTEDKIAGSEGSQKRRGGVGSAVGTSGGRSEERVTPRKREEVVGRKTPVVRRRTAQAAEEPVNSPVPVDEVLPDAGAGPVDDDVGAEIQEEDDDEDGLTPVKRPAKTPLRRKEKHAKRTHDGTEDVGAAGLLPGLGTMFQSSVDWLSDERKADYTDWKKHIYREMARVEQQAAA